MTGEGRQTAVTEGVTLEPAGRVSRIRLFAVAGILCWAVLSGPLVAVLQDSPSSTGILLVTVPPVVLLLPPLLVVIARSDDSKSYSIRPDRVDFVSYHGDVRPVDRAAFGVVKLRQGPLQRLANVASLTIDLEIGDGERVKLSDVPDPDRQYERLRPDASGQPIRPRAAVGLLRAVSIGSIAVTMVVWLGLVSLGLPAYALVDAVGPTAPGGVALGIVVIHGGIVPAALVGGVLRERSTQYRITGQYVERRVDDLVRRRRGFAVVDAIEGIDHKRGPVDALFGTGTVQLQGPYYRYDHDGPDRGDLKLRGLAHHSAVHEKLARDLDSGPR